MTQTTDLVVQEPLDVAKTFTPEGMQGLLQDIETQVKAHVPVVDTDEGRKNIVSLAYKVSQSKSLIVKTGDREVAEAKKKVKHMNGLLKIAKEFLDDLRDETRRPVTEWETEQKRIADEEAKKEAEKIDKRVADLLAVEITIPRIDAAILTDDEFDILLTDKTFEFEERQKEKAEAETAEKKRLEDEAVARKAENERLAKQKAEQDAKEADLKRQQDELAAQQKAIDDEKDRLEREAIKKQVAENIRIQAEQDRKDKEALEAKEAEERELRAKDEEERRIALLPDKEHLKHWIQAFQLPPAPKVESEAVHEIYRVGAERIEETLHVMLRQVEEL